ncbi:MAG: 5-oxoprolinase subunit PxpB [Desulfobacula sp.]|jgi:KipI family sensor histidine kinase inhibitor|uniref:5-oxoprolinase subunit PxpB n=2 Tax=Desulfobacula sp. TaxID=2593537 RepID=UPI001DF0E403|nr:5-oxoprolinase subunit PxpB [Desulfobacula sp.]MBT7794359.1 5-oxoprolinase subunit PxpB [Desulfobacula sp.]
MESRLFEKPVFRIAGDRGLLVEFGEGIDPKVNAKVRAMAKFLEKKTPKGVKEMLPTYRSLLFIYDPGVTNPDILCKRIEKFNNTLEKMEIDPFKVVEIPVCYANKFGPDMENVQKAHGLTTEEVISLHSKPEYLIYMVGFTPGFAFLGGLDEKLHTPRLTTPRMLVPEGSVGIANNQTGMYPIASPGGWQLIGKTPLKLFAPDRANPFLYKAGDKIKFKPISQTEYDLLEQKEKS